MGDATSSGVMMAEREIQGPGHESAEQTICRPEGVGRRRFLGIATRAAVFVTTAVGGLVGFTATARADHYECLPHPIRNMDCDDCNGGSTWLAFGQCTTTTSCIDHGGPGDPFCCTCVGGKGDCVPPRVQPLCDCANHRPFCFCCCRAC